MHASRVRDFLANRSSRTSLHSISLASKEMGVLLIHRGISVFFAFILFGFFIEDAEAMLLSVRDSIPPDSLKHYRSQTIEINSQRPTELAIRPTDVQSVSVDALMRETGASVLSDLLPAINSSINVREYGGLGSVALTSYRGLPAEYTIVYRDGIRLNNEQNSLSDLGSIATYGIERISLVPGIESVLLGGDAIGATVDLESHAPTSSGLEVGTSAATYQDIAPISETDFFGRGDLTLSDNFRVSVNASTENSNGAFPFDQLSTGATVLRSNNAANISHAALSADYRPGNDSSAQALHLIMDYMSSSRGAPGAATLDYQGASSPKAHQYDQNYFSALKWSDQLDTLTQVTADAQFQSQYETYSDPMIVTNSIPLADHYLNHIYGLDSRVQRKICEYVTAIGGVDLSRSTLASNENYVSAGDSNISRNRAAAFFALHALPFEGLDLVASLRYEAINLFAPQYLPQISIDYSLPATSLTLGAAYGASYHAPTVNELYWKEGGNQNLKEELAKNMEVFVQTKPSLSDNLALTLRITGFRSAVDNQIVWEPGLSFYTPENIQSTLDMGAELDASLLWMIAGPWSLTITESYTYLSDLNKTNDPTVFNKEIPYSSPEVAAFMATLTNQTIGSLSLSANYQGHRFTDAGNTELGELQPVTVFNIAFATSDFRIASTARCTLELSLRNLLNTEYQEFQDYPMPGRMIRLSAKFSYD